LNNYAEIKKHIFSLLKNGLPKGLFYHGIHHTVHVLKNVDEIAKAEKVSRNELKLIKIAVLFHDAGFIKKYDDHEAIGCKMVREILPKFNVDRDEMKLICGMVAATKIPQNPKNHLEQIIADADLVYLGTDKFKEIGDTLFEELKLFKGLKSERDWNVIQKRFIENHKFHTDYCKKTYEKPKQKNLKKVIAALNKKA